MQQRGPVFHGATRPARKSCFSPFRRYATLATVKRIPRTKVLTGGDE